MSVVWALWLRQIKRHFRSRTRLIGSLGQPILFLLALGFGLGPMFRKAGEGDYLQFLAPGVIAMPVLFVAVFSGMEIIWDRQFGFLKETLVAPVSRIQIVLGRVLGGATVAWFQGCLVFLICVIFGFRVHDPFMLPVALGVMFLLAIFCSAMGTAVASLLEDIQGFQMMMNFLVMPLFFLSNALFPLKGVPPVLRGVIHLNPLSYGIDGLRCCLTEGALYGLGADIAILCVLIAGMLALCTWLFSLIQL